MADETNKEWPEPQELDEEALKAQKRRNIWLGLSLGGLVILIGVITAARFIENISAAAGAG